MDLRDGLIALQFIFTLKIVPELLILNRITAFKKFMIFLAIIEWCCD